jgi:hypothetical protein
MPPEVCLDHVPAESVLTITFWRSRYWVRHALLAWLELPIYALRCNRGALAAQVLGAELLYIAGIYQLYSWKPTATLWVFIVPYFLSTLLMMLGNWCALGPSSLAAAASCRLPPPMTVSLGQWQALMCV